MQDLTTEQLFDQAYSIMGGMSPEVEAELAAIATAFHQDTQTTTKTSRQWTTRPTRPTMPTPRTLALPVRPTLPTATMPQPQETTQEEPMTTQETTQPTPLATALYAIHVVLGFLALASLTAYYLGRQAGAAYYASHPSLVTTAKATAKATTRLATRLAKATAKAATPHLIRLATYDYPALALHLTTLAIHLTLTLWTRYQAFLTHLEYTLPRLPRLA